jgi:hypothetical protein
MALQNKNIKKKCVFSELKTVYFSHFHFIGPPRETGCHGYPTGLSWVKEEAFVGSLRPGSVLAEMQLVPKSVRAAALEAIRVSIASIACSSPSR